MVGFVSVPEMEDCPLPETPPVIPPVTVGVDQLYAVPDGTMVPGGLLAGATVNVPPLQMVAVCAGTTGVGLTVTVTVKLVPGHGMVVVGVTVYVAV